MLDAVSLASVAAGVVPVEGTIPPIAGLIEPAPAGEDADAEEDEGTAEGVVDGETDLAVSVVTLEPTVEWLRGIFAAFGAELGANTLAAFAVIGVAGTAVGGAAMAAP